MERPDYGEAFHGKAIGPDFVVANGDRVRERLQEVGSALATFGEDLEGDLRLQRLAMERRQQQARDAQEQFEHKLLAEVGRQDEVDRATKHHMQQLLAQMLTTLQTRVTERFAAMSATLDSCQHRCLTLERGILQFRGDLPSALQVDTQALGRRCKSLASQLEAESQRAREADAQTLDAISQAERAAHQQVRRGLENLDHRCESLQGMLDDLARDEQQREAGAGRSHVALLEALQAEQRSLRREAAAREQADDAVLDAMHKFADSMRRSVKRTQGSEMLC